MGNNDLDPNIKTGKQGIVDKDGDRMEFDDCTHALNIIDYAHHEIHGGSAYVIRSFVDIPIGDVYDIQITTPNTTKWLHMTFEFDVENETIFYVYQNVAINVAGTTITAGNRDTNSANTSGGTFAGIANTDIASANSDTAVAGGVLLASGTLGSGKKFGGSSHSENEVILKQNEDYCVRFWATTAGYVNFKLDWYEHTSK